LTMRPARSRSLTSYHQKPLMLITWMSMPGDRSRPLRS
jgi:hypothetical protein